MTCTIVGPGLVGCFLGAAAGSPTACIRSAGQPRATQVLVDGIQRTWRPRLIALADAGTSRLPLLGCTRIPDTPWAALPAGARLAQNGIGQPLPVVTCFFGLDLGGDGVLRACGPPPRIVMGRGSSAWAAVARAWRAAGIVVEERADPRPAQWEKAILNATVGPLCLATGSGMAAVWADAALRDLVLRATAEGEVCARACGIAIETGLGERAARFFAAIGGHQPSLIDDPRELPWMLGALLERARAALVATPALQRIAAMVSAHRAATTRSALG